MFNKFKTKINEIIFLALGAKHYRSFIKTMQKFSNKNLIYAFISLYLVFSFIKSGIEHHLQGMPLDVNIQDYENNLNKMGWMYDCYAITVLCAMCGGLICTGIYLQKMYGGGN